MPANSRPPVSCYIRALNEEVRIEATVRAALKAVSEVVVVDSGSTDGTVRQAEAAGARVIHQDWLGGGHQKRVGEDACQHDWLLDLDADEVVTGDLADEIRALFRDGQPAANVYRIPLQYVDPSGWVWRRARAPRRNKLYDRSKVRQPADATWDQFKVPDGLTVGSLKSPLLHYTFDSIEQLVRKQIATETRRADALDAEGASAGALKVFLGLPWSFFRLYMIRGRWKEGCYGFLFAVITAFTHWYRYAILYERKRISD